MKIKVCNSKEIDLITWDAITHGFNKSFERSKTRDHFINYYHNTALGYSFHALAYNEEDVLVGSTTIIPQYYLVNGERYLFGLSGGSFVLQEFRNDIFVFHDMISEIRKYCHSHDVKALFGVSNKNSFKYAVKFLGATHLMDMQYYGLPLKFGSIVKSNGRLLLDFGSSFVCKTMIYLNFGLSFLFESRRRIVPVSIEFNELFKARRFKFGYKIINESDFFVAYKTDIEDGIKIIYLIEYRKKDVRSYRALSYAMKEIVKREQFDLLLFVGTIHHFQWNLFKIPKSKHPKRLPITYEFLEGAEEGFKNTLKNYRNWDFSLVNFDVR